MSNFRIRSKGLLVAALVVFAAGCGGGGDDSPAASEAQATPPPAGGSNSAPTIKGAPGTTVLAGQAYVFQPAAADADGDKLTFTAANLPAWAALNADTGRISGTPSAADVGAYAGIKVTVSDGKASASSATFTLNVTAVGTGSASVSWMPPTSNSDGSVLTNLAGYRIVYGHSAVDLSLSIDVDNPGMSTYVVENLSAGAWYFAVIAVNSGGVSSEPSNVASKTIS